jgi:hypothetical protein
VEGQKRYNDAVFLPLLKATNVHIDKFKIKKVDIVWKLIARDFNAQSEIKAMLA